MEFGISSFYGGVASEHFSVCDAFVANFPLPALREVEVQIRGPPDYDFKLKLIKHHFTQLTTLRRNTVQRLNTDCPLNYPNKRYTAPTQQHVERSNVALSSFVHIPSKQSMETIGGKAVRFKLGPRGPATGLAERLRGRELQAGCRHGKCTALIKNAIASPTSADLYYNRTQHVPARQDLGQPDWLPELRLMSSAQFSTAMFPFYFKTVKMFTSNAASSTQPHYKMGWGVELNVQTLSAREVELQLGRLQVAIGISATGYLPMGPRGPTKISKKKLNYVPLRPTLMKRNFGRIGHSIHPIAVNRSQTPLSNAVQRNAGTVRILGFYGVNLKAVLKEFFEAQLPSGHLTLNVEHGGRGEKRMEGDNADGDVNKDTQTKAIHLVKRMDNLSCSRSTGHSTISTLSEECRSPDVARNRGQFRSRRTPHTRNLNPQMEVPVSACILMKSSTIWDRAFFWVILEVTAGSAALLAGARCSAENSWGHPGVGGVYYCGGPNKEQAGAVPTYTASIFRTQFEMSIEPYRDVFREEPEIDGLPLVHGMAFSGDPSEMSGLIPYLRTTYRPTMLPLMAVAYIQDAMRSLTLGYPWAVGDVGDESAIGHGGTYSVDPAALSVVQGMWCRKAELSLSITFLSIWPNSMPTRSTDLRDWNMQQICVPFPHMDATPGRSFIKNQVPPYEDLIRDSKFRAEVVGVISSGRDALIAIVAEKQPESGLYVAKCKGCWSNCRTVAVDLDGLL
ncbi:hypothetical protein FB451DRAFT_1171634 [Mycena latifolia]|nr:hypothetical protein FB451DRAFT_1171634 [Mycena latifolia]